MPPDVVIVWEATVLGPVAVNVNVPSPPVVFFTIFRLPRPLFVYVHVTAAPLVEASATVAVPPEYVNVLVPVVFTHARFANDHPAGIVLSVML